MIIQCPDCKTKMAPKVAADVKPGVKISVTCRCGTKLRFTNPGKPVDKEAERRLNEILSGRNPFAGGRR